MSSSLVCFNPSCGIEIKPEKEVFFHLKDNGSFCLDHVFCRLKCLPKEGTCRICKSDVREIRFKKGKIAKSARGSKEQHSVSRASLQRSSHFILQVEADGSSVAIVDSLRNPRAKLYAILIVVTIFLAVVIWSANKYLD